MRTQWHSLSEELPVILAANRESHDAQQLGCPYYSSIVHCKKKKKKGWANSKCQCFDRFREKSWACQQNVSCFANVVINNNSYFLKLFKHKWPFQPPQNTGCVFDSVHLIQYDRTELRIHTFFKLLGQKKKKKKEIYQKKTTPKKCVLKMGWPATWIDLQLSGLFIQNNWIF